jgi:ribonuclease J
MDNSKPNPGTKPSSQPNRASRPTNSAAAKPGSVPKPGQINGRNNGSQGTQSGAGRSNGGGARRRRQQPNPMAAKLADPNRLPINKSVFNGTGGEQATQVKPRQANRTSGEPKLRVMALGGLGEIGKNMTVLEYGDDIIVLDLGSKFADNNQPGVDHLIPDITYLEKNRHKLRGIVITHGHMDHIGAAGYLLPKLPAPIYGTRFTIAMLEKQIEEFKLQIQPKMVILDADKHERVQMGAFNIELVRVGHSIPDAAAIVVRTPVGTVIDTGDWRFEPDPVLGPPMDVNRLREIGDEGVLLLMGDSTNAARSGRTPNEKLIGPTFDDLFGRANGRIIVSTFASSVNRVQLIIDAADKAGRKLAFMGRSMLANVELAVKLGYIRVPSGMITRVQDGGSMSDDKMVILCTGSQGEINAALSRMATGDHPNVKIKSTDTVILTSSPIAGNIVPVTELVDQLMREGAKVFQASTQELDGSGMLHTSGHAFHDDICELIEIVRPKFLMPIHGTFAMQSRHAEAGVQNGVKKENIFIMDIGDTLELTADTAAKTERIPSGVVYVDGSGIGDVENLVLRDRLALGSDGMVVVIATVDKKSGRLLSSPDIISRGFVHMKESEELIGRLRQEIRKSFERRDKNRPPDWQRFKLQLRDEVADLLYHKTKRNPMVLPVINEMEVR